jgi:Asp/Glu/hydantoin racemase
MRLKTITPLHLTERELMRRQARFDRLAPPPLTIALTNLPADPEVPRNLDSDEACRASEAAVYQEGLRTDPADFDGILLDCVLDPALDTLERNAPVPVFGLLKLSASYLAALGKKLAAVTRNRAIATELTAKIESYHLGDHFHGVEVLDLSFDDIADESKWNATLRPVLGEFGRRDVRAIINGCSAVDVTERHERVAVIDPTALTLELLSLAAQRGILGGSGSLHTLQRS